MNGREFRATSAFSEPLVPPMTIEVGWQAFPGEMFGLPGKLTIYDGNGDLVAVYVRVENVDGGGEWLRA